MKNQKYRYQFFKVLLIITTDWWSCPSESKYIAVSLWGENEQRFLVDNPCGNKPDNIQ